MKKQLTTGFAAFLLTLAANADTVAYYEFNGTGTAGLGSTIMDTMGAHNGTVAGGDLMYGLDPVVGSYLSFAADAGTGNPGNRVEIPGTADFLFTIDQAYTFETIFRTTQVTTNGVILSKGCDVSNPDSQWWLRHRGDGRVHGLVEGTDNSTEDSATSTATTFNDGLWHSVALIYDGTQATKRLDLYVDNQLRGSDTAIGTLGLIGGADSDPVLIGEYASLAANRSFAGDIAAVRFSNVALLPSEFLQVPEPSAFSLLLAGLVGGMASRRRIG